MVQIAAAIQMTRLIAKTADSNPAAH
jgi:hypothetical protein